MTIEITKRTHRGVDMIVDGVRFCREQKITTVHDMREIIVVDDQGRETSRFTVDFGQSYLQPARHWSEPA